MKAINKNTDTFRQNKFIFGKTAAGKVNPATLIKTFLRSYLLLENLKKKIVKVCRISQRTEAGTVNVKHKFTLNQDKDMCSLKIHDNVLLSRVANQCEHDSL